jgi:catechol 2,3-dioxygenase-like lactoylglutathione lyase family enzyme
MRLDKIAIIVDDYDQAITFFTGALGFDLVEDSPSLTNDGRTKRWVVVRPPGGETGILLAQADGERQAAAVGNQAAGRVGFFLEVDDFDAAYQRMTAAGVEFVTAARTEPYGRVAVFIDIAGNRWDLLGPAPLPELLGHPRTAALRGTGGTERHRAAERAAVQRPHLVPGRLRREHAGAARRGRLLRPRHGVLSQGALAERGVRRGVLRPAGAHQPGRAVRGRHRRARPGPARRL